MTRLLSFLTSIAFLTLFSSWGFAQDILVTLVTDDAAPKTTWWPSKTMPTHDLAFRTALGRYGIQPIDPILRNDVMFSPIAYQAGALTDNNAKGLASLFGAKRVLNGKLHWDCADQLPRDIRCTVTLKASLIDLASGRNTSIQQTAATTAIDEATAKSGALNQLASDLSLSLMARSNADEHEIPAYNIKPVLVIDALPDADTLVALRKAIKRVGGVQDIAERWVSNGTLALELNPDNPIMSFIEFESIVQALMADRQDNFLVRETRRSSRGIGIEIVNY